MLKNILVNLGKFDFKKFSNDTENSFYDSNNIIESIHNYIDFNDFIIRKGAVASYQDKKLIISLNMRDGIIIGRGRANEDWNYSSAHGSGRIIARGNAIQKIRMKDFVNSMKDVYSTSVVTETIDESPMVYKDSELIKKALDDSVIILEQLKPIINVKATT